MVATEAFADVFNVVESGTDTSPLGDSFDKLTISPSRINIVPILRSGLAMVDAVSSLLPFAVPINHLGMFRNKQLEPVEYYNNLSDDQDKTGGPVDLAIVCDPIIATGITAIGAIQSLNQCNAKKIIVISVLCAETGIHRVASHYPDVEFWVGGSDPKTDTSGWIRPGMGDVGDRLFLTIGKG